MSRARRLRGPVRFAALLWLCGGALDPALAQQ